MARSYHAGGGKTPGTCTAESIIGQDTTFKYSPTRQARSFIFLKPLPGSTHDITAIRNTSLFGHMQPWHITADIRICGFRVRYAFQEKTRQTLAGVTETSRQRDQPDPLCCRTIHRPPKNLANTIHP